MYLSVCLTIVMFCSFKPPLESLATVEETVVRDKVRQLTFWFISTSTVLIPLLLEHVTCTSSHGQAITILIYLLYPQRSGSFIV